jgi:hypothetical protein
MIQAVSGKQIAEFTRQLLASKPSLAAFGDGTEVLNYDNLIQRFGDAKWGQRSSNPMGLGTPGSDGQHGIIERLKKGFSMSGGRSVSSSSSSGAGSRDASHASHAIWQQCRKL